MNNKRIVYTVDGVVHVIIPAIDDMELVKKRAVPKEASYVEEVHVLALPQDRYFRGAWKQGKDNIPAVDMPMARKVHMDKIRVVRDKKLLDLDAQQLKVMTNPEALQKIEAEKQVLRDIPQKHKLSKFKKPDSLKESWPEGL